MIKLLKTSGLVGVLLFVLTGCGAVSVYNVQNAPITNKDGISLDKIYNSIKLAAYKRGWRVTQIKPGIAKAFIDVRGKHQATVEITYNTKEYSIKYLSSSNLKYDSDNNTIHKNYNSWIKNLDRDIQLELNYNLFY